MWPFSTEKEATKPSPDFASPSPPSTPSTSTSTSNSSIISPSPGADVCPVDHETRQAWLKQARGNGNGNGNGNPNPTSTSTSTPSSNPDPSSSSSSSAANTFLNLASSSSSSSSSSSTPSSSSSLSTEREISSIPRYETSDPSSDKANWVYPSPSQFFQAMKRKASQNLYEQPREYDMPIVVPIHNAVNERAWKQLLQWEDSWDTTTREKCGGVKLVSFVGKPKMKTWRAWFRECLGYQAPFDRHDWIIDRCGHRMRYIIDFYSGKSFPPPPSSSSSGQSQSQLIDPNSSSSNEERMNHDGKRKEFVSFYLDVRPAPDTIEGCLMRLRKRCKNWTGI